MVLRDGSVKVADFGIACLANSANTLTQEALGSVHYMSPEQARGDRTDARSDIYSAGVVLYEMLTGRLPFEGDSAVSVAIQHLSSVPLSPREINPDVPEALELICMKAMASELEKRYASADEMLADLEEFRKNPEVDLDFTIEDLHRETVDEPTQYIPAVHAVSNRAQPVPEEEDDDDPPRKKDLRRVFAIAASAVVAVAIIVLLWRAIFSDLFDGEQKPTEYVVPSLVGMTIDEANENENVKGIFVIEQIGQRASSKYAEGQIIEQFIQKEILPMDARLVHRGIGMIWGIDFNGIAPEKAIEVIHKAFDNQLILEVAGRHDGVVKIMPPLTIEDDTLMEGLQIVKKSIAEVLN